MLNQEKTKQELQAEIDQARMKYLTRGLRVVRLPAQEEKQVFGIRAHKQRNKIMG